MEKKILIPRSVIVTECCICLDTKVTINQPCRITTHRICNECITSIVKNLPISKNDPHIRCQYPFMQCDAKYGKTILKTILKENYPLYEKISRIYVYDGYRIIDCPACNAPLAEDLDYDECDETMDCDHCNYVFCKRCYNECPGNTCINCMGFMDINPEDYNYFFPKKDRKDICDYKLKNKDITIHLALDHILSIIKTKTIQCPICYTKLHKSEQCNGLSHCHTEICYSCGMFSDIAYTLKDHWSARGSNGCPRWDSDPVILKNIPEYVCKEDTCFSHSKGDCKVEEHQEGIRKKEEFFVNRYIYHALKSLVPRIRYKVIDLLPNKYRYIVTDNIWDYLDNNHLSHYHRNDYL